MKIFTQWPVVQSDRLVKPLLLMRLVLILCIAGIFQASATGYGQEVTLVKAEMRLKDVFKAIRIQTGYSVLWNSGQLDAEQAVHVDFNKIHFSDIMEYCLKGKGVHFTIEDKSIVIRPGIVVYSRPQANRQDSVIYKGRVVDEKGSPMTGATVRVSGSSRSTFTNKSGDFSIYGPRRGSLLISFVGYQGQELTLMGLKNIQELHVSMIPGYNNLGEVSVVSTGYQDLPKERATGSFEVISKEQLQHSTDPNLLRRLEGITTSMNFNNQLIPNNSSNRLERKSLLTNLTIRGKNTLLPNAPDNVSGQVLVVIDGIASPYPTPGSPYLLDQINPNDVESVTILKDAAAASIWGSRAANGVIVVKTKRGGFNRPATVSFNSNFNVTEKLDLFYKRLMSTSDYIDAERRQFNSLYSPSNPAAFIPDPTLNGIPQPIVSPVFEILNRQKRGQITLADATAQLDALRGNDIRRDYTDYFLRNAVRQSYSLGVDGGSRKVSYRLSAGYDKTINNTRGSDGDRINLGYNVSASPFKGIELRGDISYSLSRTNDQAAQNTVTANSLVFFPYTRIVDESGNPIVVPSTYRSAFVDLLESSYGSRILGMRYVPLEDINEGYYRTSAGNLNLNLSAEYKPNQVLSAGITYNYNKGMNESKLLYRQNSYYMRQLINTLTDPVTFTRNLPLGGYYQTLKNDPESQTVRGQLNLNKSWTDKHVLSAIAGTDISQTYSLTSLNSYLGYNESTLASTTSLNFLTAYPRLFLDANGRNTRNLPLPLVPFSSYKVRTFGVFANAAYTYGRRYTVSGSLRKDGSSQFGQGVNKTGTPFWSAGASWNINNESFYHLDVLPVLQLRATYGYNGNVNPGVVANPQVFYGGIDGNINLPYAYTNTGSGGSDASNYRLRPEKSGILNIGLDFGFRNGRIAGSIEYYDKRTTDLLNSAPVDPTTGFARLVFNTASLRGRGWDLNLRSVNVQSALFRWSTNFLFSYNRVKVTEVFDASVQNVNRFLNGSPINVGYDLSRLFAYRWAGLDPLTGDPRGYLNDQVVTISAANANAILPAMDNSPASSSTLKYMGSATPVYYGSLRNTFSYGALSISVNLMYKLGYYFRRNDPVNYYQLFNNNSRTLQGVEYEQRWQRPGDELLTNVPSLTFPVSQFRDQYFYALSEVNVLKGDHVRLQEINLSYSLNRKSWFIKNPRVYANVSNLGVVWRANKLGIDPDTQDYPSPRTYSLGLSANF